VVIANSKRWLDGKRVIVAERFVDNEI